MQSILTFLFYVVLCIFGQKEVYSPNDFGLNTAQNGEQRYEAVYKAHKAAYENGGRVSYEGIQSIDLVIPDDAKSIPLVLQTDFQGVVFNVLNTKTDFYLFLLTGPKPESILIDKQSITHGSFRRYRQLKRGCFLLAIEDKNSWVLNRKGYNYGAIRKDILFLRKGKATNLPIATYDNVLSEPLCSFIPASTDLKYVRNLTLNRDSRSSCRTFLLRVSKLNNVELSGLTVRTPEPVSLDRDAAIRIINCTNVVFQNLVIDRTYSGHDLVGYGIVMNNVWNVFFSNVKADGNWGVFDNNNVSTITVSDSEINRFDLHCYGRDFSFFNCKFNRIGQPLSSFYGKLVFNKCIFDHVTSCSYRQEYNAYTPFDLEYNNCVFNLDGSHYSIINLLNLSNEINTRPELSKKSLPNLMIKDCNVNLTSDMTKWEIFHVGKVDYEEPLSGVSRIVLDGLKVNGADANVYLFSTGIETLNDVDVSISHVDLLQTPDDSIRQASTKYTYNPSILFNINQRKSQRIIVTDSRLNYNVKDNPRYDISFIRCTLGRLRSYNTGNGNAHSRRYFSDCKIILDCNDSSNYLIDANADYKNCTFIPCEKGRRIIPSSMEEGAFITFDNCTIQGGTISVEGVDPLDFLRDSRLDISTKRITRINGNPLNTSIND